ncbi:MGMT family protein [Alkalihalobacillus sp. MEB130]|uniref:MGMT family protein n=1 Tax=Alkalihalobacillus sp. MEB130 TaxID=2976704 RepID=UPI0028DF4A3F|nr:MGMT family protein [Alkalihalobacillus sp. MEB130]MDT8861248.1 MGMT family protein [Alkalihalobacillus sp. MEB130]
MQPFTERVLKIILHIPKGKVMTYGQVANLAGSPKAARQVVRILHSMSKKHQLPWHRLVNSKGEISIKNEELLFIQKMSLEAEEVKVENDKVNLDVYQFNPQRDQKGEN